MTQTKTAENTQSVTLPRPITAIVAAINELIVLCESTIRGTTCPWARYVNPP